MDYIVENKPSKQHRNYVLPVDAQPHFKLSGKLRIARFGTCDIEESQDTVLVSQQEKELYRKGFKNLQRMVAESSNEWKFVLLSPEITSCVIGLQPICKMDKGKAAIIYQSFLKTGENFNATFHFFKSDQYKDLYTLLNIQAARFVLERSKEVLNLSISPAVLSDAQITKLVADLISSAQPKTATLIKGLLSGYPLDDCRMYTNKTTENLPKLEQSANLDELVYLNTTSIDQRRVKFDPLKFVDPVSLSQFQYLSYLPDITVFEDRNNIISGFGLSWVPSQTSLQKGTIQHCQKLLEIDRYLGLINYVESLRKQLGLIETLIAITKANGSQSQSFIDWLSRLLIS